MRQLFIYGLIVLVAGLAIVAGITNLLGAHFSDEEPLPTRVPTLALQPFPTLEPVVVEPPTALPTIIDPPIATPTDVPTIAVEVPPVAEPTEIVSVEPVQPEIPPQVASNQVVVQFASDTTPEQQQTYLDSIHATVSQSIDPLNAVVVTIPPDQVLPASPVVAATEPDPYVVALEGPFSDPLYSQQWALTAINAPLGWQTLPADTPTITVALIDSGVCSTHPDLVGRVLDGWDFVDDDADPQDQLGHGCAVAGILAANGNNGTGIVGIAPNIRVMPLRVLNAQGIGVYSDVAAAISYAVVHGARIINLSLGGAATSSLLEEAINYAQQNGVLVIAATGNTGTDGVLYPAAYPNVIAVGSVDVTLQRSSFSTTGPEVDILAPGRDILTTRLDGSYGVVSGTSFAAPHVTGIAALDLALGLNLTLDGGVVSFSGPAVVVAPTSTPDQPTPDPDQPTPPPLPDGRTSPLRVMIPSEDVENQMYTQGITSLAQMFPNLDPEQSFSPGPRMNLPISGQANGQGVTTPFRTLAILVKFNDKANSTAASYFDNLLFGTSGATMRSYYNEVSYSQLDIVTLNLPSSLGWITAPQPYSYYVNNSYCDGPYPNDCRRLTEDVVNLVNNTLPQVNFANYDNDGDGYVDTVFIIHAGPGAESTGSTRDIWSHSWWTYNEPYVDGVWVGSYTVEPETTYGAPATRGVFAHELGHALGLPDLYDITYSSKGVGRWSLMSGGSWLGPNSNGSMPAHLDAWSRLYLGFTTATNASTFDQQVTLPNVEQNSTGAIYRLNTSRANEYFLLENRQQIGSDGYLPGAGLLIWHVDENVAGSNRYACSVRNNYTCTRHFRVALEQADGLFQLETNSNSGDTGDPWPGSSSRTVFDFSSTPNTSSYYFSTDPGLLVNHISASANTMSAFIGHVPPAPLLIAPTHGVSIADNTPTLTWEAVGTGSYEIQIDNVSYFNTPEQVGTSTTTSFTTDILAESGTYFWRVRFISGDSGIGIWSAPRSFTIDQSIPAAPALLLPANLAQLTNKQPRFVWTAVVGAVQYELQIDTQPDFLTAESITAPTRVYIAPANTLSWGTYYWRVRAIDAANNAGVWSPGYRLDLTILRAPTNAAYAITSRQVFTWAAVAGATGYVLDVRDQSNAVVCTQTAVGILTVSKTCTNLAYGTYTWNVQIQPSGEWMANPWTLTVSPPQPTAPIPQTPARSNSSTPSFYWSAVCVDCTYQIQIDDDPLNRHLEFNTTVGDVTSFTAPTPLRDGVYYWRVRAINQYDLAGTWSVSRAITIDTVPLATTPALGQPLDRAGIRPAANNAFSWTAAAGAAWYQLQVDTDPNFGSVPLIYDWTSPNAVLARTVPANTFTPGTYYWRVRGFDLANNPGPWSAARIVIVDATITPSAAPILNSATPLISKNPAPDLLWSDLAGDGQHYQVQIDNDPYFRSAERDLLSAVDAASLTVTPALPDKVYYWRVRTINSLGIGGVWSAARSLTIDTTAPLAPVLGLPADRVGVLPTSAVNFTWTAAATAARYQIQIATENTFADPVFYDYTSPRPIVSQLRPANSFPAGTYYWRVRALDAAANEGAWSVVRTLIITTTPTAPAAPVINAASPATTNDSTPDLLWVEMSGGYTYQVQIDNDPYFRHVDRQTITAAASYTVDPALADGTYFWRVQAINPAGIASVWTTARRLVIDTVAPLTPAQRSPVNGGRTASLQPIVTWAASAGATAYQIDIAQDANFTLIRHTIPLGNVFAAQLPTLPYGRYSWRVSARDAAGNWSVPSAGFILDITTMTGPVPNQIVVGTVAPFRWIAAAAGFAQYIIQYNDSPDFSAPLDTVVVSARTLAYNQTLPYGIYYWRLCADYGSGCLYESDWMPAWKFTLTAGAPFGPVLVAPAYNTLTTSNVPLLSWYAGLTAARYEIQIDNNATFTSPEVATSATTTYTSPSEALPNGRWYWRVRSVNAQDVPSAWTVAWVFTVNGTAPGTPTIIAPLDHANITNPQLVFSWNAVPDAVAYEIEVDQNPPIRVNAISYRWISPLSAGSYTWRVRAVNVTGAVSAWTEPRTFDVVVGITGLEETPTAEATIEPTATPTLESTTLEPTLEATLDPATAVPTLPLVESEMAQQAGQWTSYASDQASGGSYLFSSGSLSDTLTLGFSGTQIEIIYVQHPALASFVVEIDGSTAQIVNSRAEATVFGMRAVITTLSAGSHVLRIIPVDGTLAIDAFAVAGLAPLPEPTSTPTPDPTIPPTLEPTVAPTTTPMPLAIPFTDNFTSDQGWTGAWLFDMESWFASTRGTSITLTANTLIDLRMAFYPHLSFMQRGELSAVDTLTVDISVDGGLSWLVVDQQTGVFSPDWQMRDVDLTAFAGQMILLRFRLDTTQPLAEGMISTGIWIDTLTVQEIPPTPPTEVVLPTEIPTETIPPTEIPTEIAPEVVITDAAPVETPSPEPPMVETPAAE